MAVCSKSYREVIRLFHKKKVKTLYPYIIKKVQMHRCTPIYSTSL